MCASPYSLVDGRRQSTTVAYLDPARDRPNLTILADTAVTRVCLDGDRATGVEVRAADGSIARYDASRGRPDGRGLPLAAAPDAVRDRTASTSWSATGSRRASRSTGWAADYQDHAVVYITFQGTTDLREDYVIPKVRLIAKSDPDRAVPDLHVFMQPSIRMEGMPPLLPVSIRLLEHRSRGRVRLASADPTELPVVEPGLLAGPRRPRGDPWRLRAGPAAGRPSGARRVLRSAPRSGPGQRPGASTSGRATSATTTASAPVGSAPTATQGRCSILEFRVRGVHGLRVADASVLPTVPHANTNLSAILVGEMAARLMASD